jgi:hypothetical protein
MKCLANRLALAECHRVVGRERRQQSQRGEQHRSLDQVFHALYTFLCLQEHPQKRIGVVQLGPGMQPLLQQPDPVIGADIQSPQLQDDLAPHRPANPPDFSQVCRRQLAINCDDRVRFLLLGCDPDH